MYYFCQVAGFLSDCVASALQAQIGTDSKFYCTVLAYIHTVCVKYMKCIVENNLNLFIRSLFRLLRILYVKFSSDLCQPPALT